MKDKGGRRSQFTHVIDIVPTLYELIGITPPTELNGVPQKPIEGISFAYTFDDAKTLTYYAGQVGLPPEGSPRVLNKSWGLTADVEMPEGGADRMIVTHGASAADTGCTGARASRPGLRTRQPGRPASPSRTSWKAAKAKRAARARCTTCSSAG